MGFNKRLSYIARFEPRIQDLKKRLEMVLAVMKKLEELGEDPKVKRKVLKAIRRLSYDQS